MLPKVANTLLHTSSRAVAVVQNQTHTFRNVLQLQSSPSGSNKNGPGANGPSAGSSKHTGSRFYSGYHTTLRATSQANIIVATDGFLQYDDTEEPAISRPAPLNRIPGKRRLRSHSLSLNSANRDVAERLGVLKSVQLHARSRHAFAYTPEPAEPIRSFSPPPPSAPSRSRRNSTVLPSPTHESPRHNSTLAHPTNPFVTSDASLPTSNASLHHPDPLDPTTPQSVSPPVRQSETSYVRTLHAAGRTKDPSNVAEVVSEFQQVVASPSVQEYNAALHAIYETRPSGEPLTLLFDTYNAMLRRGLLPNYKTYLTLLMALTSRDQEVYALLRAVPEVTTENQDADSPAAYVIPAARREALEKENNFASAMAVFKALVTLNLHKLLHQPAYLAILRSCALHGSVDNALAVWSALESSEMLKPFATAYRLLITTYSRAGQIDGVREIFSDFRDACVKGRIDWSRTPAVAIKSQAGVYDAMVEVYFQAGMPDLAVGLVEEMLNAPGRPNSFDTFDPSVVPPPTPKTFQTVLDGFIRNGDVPTALSWFQRLIEQPTKSSDDAWMPTLTPTRPQKTSWTQMLGALANQNMVIELREMVDQYWNLRIGPEDGIWLTLTERLAYTKAIGPFVQNLQASITGADPVGGAKTQELIDNYLGFIRGRLLQQLTPKLGKTSRKSILSACLAFGPILGFSVFQHIMTTLHITRGKTTDSNIREDIIRSSQALVTDYAATMAPGDMTVPFSHRAYLAYTFDNLAVERDTQLKLDVVGSYLLARDEGTLPPPSLRFAYSALLVCAAELVVDGHGASLPISFPQLLEQLAGIEQEPLLAIDQMSNKAIHRVVDALLLDSTAEAALDYIAARLTPAFTVLISRQITERSERQSDASSASPTQTHSTAPTSPLLQTSPRVYIDHKLGKLLDDEMSTRVFSASKPALVIHKVIKLHEQALSEDKVAPPFTLGRLCQALGRAGMPTQAKEVYKQAQSVLASLEDDKQYQSDGWFMVEDSMVIALAQAGDIDGAHLHRRRIIDHGGAPSADAYGGLILHVKDTTDDTANAMALYEESKALRVVPNQYLFNNIISKLAKARKADHALELFEEMKACGIAPSSITFGALIGARARVGDVDTAESLFEDMVKQKGFRPRVPPYNTMMQLYTTTKPNRDRSLYFYDQLLRAGVQPTSYTYKLLMDTYVLDPLDINNVEQVFQDIVNNPKIELLGSHFATLLHAYGCVLKDLPRAMALFDSIPSYARAPPLDPIVIEAMINVLVVHRRMDLVPEYVARMSFAGVHMTAYIVNAMIRGYALVGDLDTAREIFEGLSDPPQGVAAPNNHAPHSPLTAPVVNPLEPVYREPSTWEAMIRAELGVGNHDAANTLLERLKERHYPDAVFNRIGGIMVDHSQILPS